MGQTPYPWRSTSCSSFTNDVCYDVPYNDGTGFGVQFQHFFQAFFLRYDKRQYAAGSTSLLWMDGRLRIHLEMWIGTWVTRWKQLVQQLALQGLSHSWVEQTLREARSIVHYLTMDRITTLWLVKGKHIMTLVVYRCCCWQHWKFQWFLSPSSNLNFWDHIWLWDVYYVVLTFITLQTFTHIFFNNKYPI